MKKRKKTKKIKTKKLIPAATTKSRPGDKKAKESKRERMQQVAKLGKRKYNRAVEEMAIEKISKKTKHKKYSGEGISETVSVREPDYRAGNIIAGPDVAPVGIKGKKIIEVVKKEKPDKKLSQTELNRYIKTLKSRGRKPKRVKVIENKDKYFTIQFVDGTNGEITICSHAKGWEI